MSRIPVTGKDTTDNILSYLFKKVCIELNINNVTWHRLLDNYVNNPLFLKIEGMTVKNEQREIKRRASLRSNLDTSLTSHNMTIDNFVKGIRMLKPDTSILRVEIELPKKHVVKEASQRIISTSVNLPIYAQETSHGAILATMLKELHDGISPNKEETKLLTELFLTDPCNGISEDKKLKSSASSNLIRSLTSDRLTWTNFQRCLYYLRPFRIKVSLDLSWKFPKKTTGHSVEFKPNFLRG